MAKRTNIASNPFHTKQFKELNEHWRQKLKESGFVDQEDKYGNIKHHDIRTQAWENRDGILDFYLRLDQFMNFYTDMPKFERQVMELFSQGYYVTEIAKQINGSRVRLIHKVIKRYKGLMSAIQKMESGEVRADFPHPLKPKSYGDSGEKDGSKAS